MKIEILGVGCPKCKILYENVLTALKNAGKEAEVEKVEDLSKITKYAVMTTPALVIDGIISANNPIYDLQRYGVNFVASPRHADALLVTGPLSKNMLTALKNTYEAMTEPKFVITCGDCASNCGLFKGSYYVVGAVKDILPVSLHIPGCPPSPTTIIQTLLAFLQKGVSK